MTYDIRRLLSEHIDNELSENIRPDLQKQIQGPLQEEWTSMQGLQRNLEQVCIPQPETTRCWERLSQQLEARKIKKQSPFSIVPIPIFASLLIVIFILPFLNETVINTIAIRQDAPSFFVGDMGDGATVDLTNTSAVLGDVISSEDTIFQNDFDTFIDFLVKSRPSNGSRIIILPDTDFDLMGEPRFIPVKQSSTLLRDATE